MERICASLTTSNTRLAYAAARAPGTARGARAAAKKACRGRGASAPGHVDPSHSKTWSTVDFKDLVSGQVHPCRTAAVACRLAATYRLFPTRALSSAPNSVTPFGSSTRTLTRTRHVFLLTMWPLALWDSIVQGATGETSVRTPPGHRPLSSPTLFCPYLVLDHAAAPAQPALGLCLYTLCGHRY